MQAADLAHQRLISQHIGRQVHRDPAEVVASLGAIQAQDHAGGLWAIGLRTRGAVEADVKAAVARRAIVRTWPMRGTLHFVAAADVRFLLALLAPRSIARSAGRYRQLELDEQAFARSRKLLTAALRGGRQLTRSELYARLERGGVSPAGQRGIHVLGRLAQEGLICHGPQRGKQATFVLLEEWLPPAKHLEREEALAELAQRYFTGHGPATERDLAWWTGLSLTEARTALGLAAARLARVEVGGVAYWMSRGASPPRGAAAGTHLLPPFDEYLVGYTDRSAVVAAAHAQRLRPHANGLLSPVIVSAGAVVGTWGRTFRNGAAHLTLKVFTRLPPASTRALVTAAESYGRYLNVPVEVSGPRQA